ncbi:MAG: sigma 54-interacting transcriptional regulator, partial [Fibrobacter sp.]|nr:sigma 54-interacting transcriptional regulator [Fibrobacter sp.]
MITKILFLDSFHLASRIAEQIALKKKLSQFVFKSAGISPEMETEELRILFDNQNMSIVPVCSYAEIARQRFDLVVTIGKIATEANPIFIDLPPVINWELDEIVTMDSFAFDKLYSDLSERIKGFFNHGFVCALVNQKLYLENVLNSLHEGVIAHDLERRVFLFSRGAEEITGVMREEVLGRDCHDLFKPRICGEQCIFCSRHADRNFVKSSFHSIFTAGEGGRKEIEITRLPLIDSDGRITGAIMTFSDSTRLHELEMKLGEVESFNGIIGQDYAMLQIFELIQDLARSDFPVVVTGESGTGKELIAAAIHKESDRRDCSFIAVNCGALPEGTLESELFGHVRGAFTGAIRDKKGRFELADKGTLFLDEIAELTPRMQVKLLRVLQEGVIEPVGSEVPKKVDVRIICATNRNLSEMVAKGEFREDLFYRLAVVPIVLPPLRERRNDIILLARHFLDITSKKLGKSDVTFSDDTISLLMNYNWPGNIRQLQNVIQFALIKCRGKMV